MAQVDSAVPPMVVMNGDQVTVHISVQTEDVSASVGRQLQYDTQLLGVCADGNDVPTDTRLILPSELGTDTQLCHATSPSHPCTSTRCSPRVPRTSWTAVPRTAL